MVVVIGKKASCTIQRTLAKESYETRLPNLLVVCEETINLTLSPSSVSCLNVKRKKERAGNSSYYYYFLVSSYFGIFVVIRTLV